MILVDGEVKDQISTLDRGLAFGDGVFETLRVQHGQVRFWQAHWKRLEQGCHSLGIPLNINIFQKEAKMLLESCEDKNAILKLILSRGCGGRGYTPPKQPNPTRIAQLHPWPGDYASPALEGIIAWRCQHPLSRNRRLAGIKHLNRLDQVLASAELPSDVREGLMFDDAGQLIEGTRSNVFLVQSGELMTPSLEAAGVAGVMRAELLKLAAGLGIPTHARALDETALLTADEVLVCNSVLGIWPVTSLLAGSTGAARTELRRWPIGPLTRQLQQALNWEPR